MFGTILAVLIGAIIIVCLLVLLVDLILRSGVFSPKVEEVSVAEIEEDEPVLGAEATVEILIVTEEEVILQSNLPSREIRRGDLVLVFSPPTEMDEKHKIGRGRVVSRGSRRARIRLENGWMVRRSVKNLKLV